MPEFLPNEDDRPLVTVRGPVVFREPASFDGAIVRLFPQEGDSDEAVEVKRRAFLSRGAAVVRTMPRPAPSKAPGAPAGERRGSGAREVLAAVVVRMAEARKLEGFEGEVEGIATEVGL